MLQPTTKQRRVSHVTSTAITTIALLLGCIASASAQQPQSESGDKKQLTVAELKTIYLDCDRDVMRGLLGGAEAKACSVVYEELKKRAFDGDFDKFLAWSRVQNSANIAAR
jgi:hypothetical protein